MCYRAKTLFLMPLSFPYCTDCASVLPLQNSQNIVSLQTLKTQFVQESGEIAVQQMTKWLLIRVGDIKYINRIFFSFSTKFSMTIWYVCICNLKLSIQGVDIVKKHLFIRLIYMYKVNKLINHNIKHTFTFKMWQMREKSYW